MKITRVFSVPFHKSITTAHIEALNHFGQFKEANAERYELLCEFVDDAGAARITELINRHGIVGKCDKPTPSGIEHERSVGHMTRRDEFAARNAVVNGKNNNKGMRLRTGWRVAYMILTLLRHELPHVADPLANSATTYNINTRTFTSTKSRSRASVTRPSTVAAAAALPQSAEPSDDDDSFDGSEDADDLPVANPIDSAIRALTTDLADPKLPKTQRQVLQESIAQLTAASARMSVASAPVPVEKYGRFTPVIKQLNDSRRDATEAQLLEIDQAVAKLKAAAAALPK